MKFEYIIYDNDEIPVFLGNSIEAAKYLGVTLASFYCNISRCKIGKIKGFRNGFAAYKVENNENE